MKRFIRSLTAAMALLGLPAMAAGQALTLDIEAMVVPNVGASWVTVNTVNTYSTPVVSCTYNLASSANPTAAVRMRNAGATSFDIRLQQFENSSTVTPGNVHCLVVDDGVHTLPDGRVIEAHTVLSDATSGNAVGWGITTTENVTTAVTHNFSNLIMVGQVMTFNDARASVFWVHNCVSRGASPTNAAICVGKHIGQINSTRANETLGYIAFEAGTGTVNDIGYAFGITSDSIAGVGNSPPYSFSVSGDFDIGVAQSAGEDGGQGGWAVLYGTDPLPNNQIRLAIDEEVVAGDTGRSHTNEQVFYAVFDNNQTADIDVVKTNEIYSGSSSPYAIPGSDVIYTLNVESLGSAGADDDTLFLVDTLPADVRFYNGDMDDGGPATGPVLFDAMNSGVTLNLATDVGYSSSATKPTSFAACTYAPVAGYDLNVRHVCFAPQGRLKAGTLETDTDFTLSFRAQIN